MELDKKECMALYRCIKQEPRRREDIFKDFLNKTIMISGLVPDYLIKEYDRRLRKVIKAMQLIGFPIGTTTDGYFLADKSNPELYEKFLKQTHNRIKNESKIYYAGLRTFKEIRGQKRIPGFGHWWKEHK